jgi:acetyl-CoA carboxylase biotin carboxylase subunit
LNKKKNFSRVLIANRGEIALRIIRACQELGLETIAAVSEADKDSLPARRADRAICIGPPQPIKSYLQVDTIISAALGTGAEAIHPGYGFLAEQPELAEACDRYGLVFIGPRPEQIRKMGDKIWARKIARDLGVPVIPGSEQVQKAEEAGEVAHKLGYPILIKAAAGGGGRGMKVVRNASDLKYFLSEAGAEAHAAFGDNRLYMEKYVANARHIEVQIMGDQQGNIVHLFERDCSLQRRHQKMVEEAPCPILTPELRQEICGAALSIARNIKYLNAGTIEFIWDQDQEIFYFLEMNTRIQVEHPVTEMITGVDLVREQIRVAGGEELSFRQDEIRTEGHAIECRINAESPGSGFLPCPGQIREWRPPDGPNLRVDTHCYPGYSVPPYYDSLLAKIISKGGNRLEAIETMQRALANFHVEGVDTTIPFYQSLLKKPEYHAGAIHTGWIENNMISSKDA